MYVSTLREILESFCDALRFIVVGFFEMEIDEYDLEDMFEDTFEDLTNQRNELLAELHWIANAFPVTGGKLNYAGRVLALRAQRMVNRYANRGITAVDKQTSKK